MEDEGGLGQANYEGWHAHRFPGVTPPPFGELNAYARDAWIAGARAVYARSEALLVRAAAETVAEVTRR
jgi:hypothetical protein